MIHLIRRPWESAKSQYLHAWKPNVKVVMDTTMMDSMVGVLREMCESIRTCARRLHAIAHETSSPLLTIRYEDMAELDEGVVLGNLFSFLNESSTAAMIDTIVTQLKSKKFAPLPTPADILEREAVVRAVEADSVESRGVEREESCKEVYTHFGYSLDHRVQA